MSPEDPAFWLITGFSASVDVAHRRLMSHLPASLRSISRWMSPRFWLRWLYVWLYGIPVAVSIAVTTEDAAVTAAARSGGPVGPACPAERR
jgi:hypothetical protein